MEDRSGNSWMPHPRNLYEPPPGPPHPPMMRGHPPHHQPPRPGGYGPGPAPHGQFIPHQGPPPSGRWGPPPPSSGGGPNWSRGPPPPQAMPPHPGYSHPRPPMGYGGMRGPPPVHYNQMRADLVQDICSLRAQLNDSQTELKKFEVQHQEQSAESERNLAAHSTANQQERDRRIDEILQNQRLLSLQQQAKSVGLTVEAMDQALQQLMESCTKDNIAKGKVWINQRITETSRSADVIAQYLLHRVASVGADFTLRLHIVYLINDLIHNLKRKPCAPLQTALDSIVVPIFCLAFQSARTEDEESTKQRRNKLEKVLSLWKSNQLFPSNLLERLGCNCIDQLKLADPTAPLDSETEAQLAHLVEEKINASAALWRTEECTKHSEHVQPILQHYQEQFAATERQFSDFAMHLQQELTRRVNYCAQMESRVKAEEDRLAAMDAEEAQKVQLQQPPPTMPPPPTGNVPPVNAASAVTLPDFSLPPPGFNPSLPPPNMSESGGPNCGFPSAGHFSGPPPGPTPLFPPGSFHASAGAPYERGAPKNVVEIYEVDRESRQHDFHEGPPVETTDHHPEAVPKEEAREPWNEKKEDQQHPTNVPPPAVEDRSVPRLPFWDLPAALMIPLIPLSRFEYRSLDPKKLRLPPPPLKREEERIKQALEAFYSPPNHERPRDADGWEKLGLYEFHKNKESAMKRHTERKRRKSERQEKRRGNSADSSRNTTEEDADVSTSEDEEDFRFQVDADSWMRWEEEQRQLKLEAMQRAAVIPPSGGGGWMPEDESGFGNGGSSARFLGAGPGSFHQGIPRGPPPGPGMLHPRIGPGVGPPGFRGFPPSVTPPGMMAAGGPPRPGGQPPMFMPAGRGGMMRPAVGAGPSLMGTPSPAPPMMMRQPPGYSEYNPPFDSGHGFYRGRDEGRRSMEGGSRTTDRQSRFSGGRSRSRSRSGSRSRSDSRSRSSRMRDYSRSRSRSRTSYSSRGRSNSRSRSRSRSRTRSRSRSRSPGRSPPRLTSAGMLLVNERRGFMGSSAGGRGGDFLGEPGRGHPSFGGGMGASSYDQRALQLMERMGWSGRGLGMQEQGRLDPIDAMEQAGGPRSRMEQYRGVGMGSDPFTQFRQRKSDGFSAMVREGRGGSAAFSGEPPPADAHLAGGRQSRYSSSNRP